MRRVEYKGQLVDYFKKNLQKGYTEDSLKFALFKQGYSRAIVENALKEANHKLAKEAPVLKEKPVIKYEVYDQDNNIVHLEPLSTWEKVKYFFKGKKFK